MKGCPLCAEPIKFEWHDRGHTLYVECKDCEFKGSIYHEDEGVAEEVWDQRIDENDIQGPGALPGQGYISDVIFPQDRTGEMIFTAETKPRDW